MSDAATATATSPPTAAKLFAKASEAEMKRVLDAVASRHGGNFYFKTKCGRTVVVVYSVEFVGKQWHFRVGAAIHTIQNLSKSGKLFSGTYKQATAPSKAALRVTACGRFLRRPLYLEVGRYKVEDTAASAVVCTDATASPIALFENRDAVRAVLTNFFTKHREVHGDVRERELPAFMFGAAPVRQTGAGAGAGAAPTDDAKRTAKDRKTAHRRYLDSIDALRASMSSVQLRVAKL
jgi:hypothetical protein